MLSSRYTVGSENLKYRTQHTTHVFPAGQKTTDVSSGSRDFLTALLECSGHPVFLARVDDGNTRNLLYSSIENVFGAEVGTASNIHDIGKFLARIGVREEDIQSFSGAEPRDRLTLGGMRFSPSKAESSFVVDVFPVSGADRGDEFLVGVMRSPETPETASVAAKLERDLQALMFRGNLDAISVVRQDGVCIFESIPPQSNLPADILSNAHPEDAPGLSAWISSAVTTSEHGTSEHGNSECFEYRVPGTSGEWRSMRAEAEEYGVGTLAGGRVIRSREVPGGSPAAAADESLMDTDFRSLVDNLYEVVTICRLDGTIRYASPSMKRTFGYEPEAMTGRNVFDFVHPEDAEQVRQRTEEAMQQPEVARNMVAYRFLHADGTWRYVESSGVYLVDDPGVRGVLVNSRDVTASREAEKRLEEAETRYRTLVEQVPGIIYIRDFRTGATLYDSPRLHSILGYPPDICRREPHYWAGKVHPEDLHLLRGAGDGGDHTRAEYRVFASDGRVVWLRDDAVMVRDEAGEPVCWQGMRLDITALKETEASLRESEENSRRNSWELSLLHGLRTAVHREMETEQILSIGVEFIAATYGYTQVSAYTLEGGELLLRHQVGYDEVISNMPVDVGIMGKTVREGRAVLIRDVHDSEEFVGAIEGIVSEVCVPLPGDGGEILGVLNLESVGGMVLDEEDLRIAGGLGETLGIAVSRARLYDKMRDTERKYRTLVEQIPAVTYVQTLSHDHTVTYVSPQISGMLGYQPQEFYADDALWYEVVHPEDRERVLAQDDRTDQTGEPFSMEYRMVGRAGNVVWISDEATLLRDADGRSLFWHGMLYDVTERKMFDEALQKSEERFRSLVQNASDLIIILDHDHRITYLSPSIEKIQGFTVHESTGKSAFRNIHPEDVGSLNTEFARLLEDPSYEPVVDFRLRHSNGSWRHMEAVGRNLLDDPAVGGIVVNARDITARKKTEEALRESESRLSSVTSGAPIIFFGIDMDGYVTLAKGKGLATLGLAKGAAVGQNVFEAFGHLSSMVDGVRRAMAGEEASVVVEIRDLYFDAKYSPVRDGVGEITGVVGVATDMTGRRKLEKELEYRAFHDPLTGLANRSLCMNRLSHALERGRRDGCPVSILFMDLDDFKMVNDSFGHDTGDMLLVEAAERLSGCVRPGDTLARLGGDEFVVVLEDTGLGEATTVARRIEEVLERPFHLGSKEQERYVTFSTGITVSDGCSTTAEDMLREADLAMYRAKDDGKASYAVFDAGMSAHVMQRIDLERSIRRALDDGEFEVYYQPIVSVATGKVSCLEALVRWRRPGVGIVSPDEFVALAEETSLILPIGQLVLQDACRNLKKWSDSYPGENITVSVNLSARQVRHPGLAAGIAWTLEETGISPGDLKLEITESVAMSDGPETETLSELKRLGIGLMIDDFGTGHSSLSYLRNLPVDGLKIDRTFCAGLLDSNAVDREIVAAIIRLGHATGLEVVAEGVETPEQLAYLRDLDCDFAQGFLMSRAIPASMVPALLGSDFFTLSRIQGV